MRTGEGNGKGSRGKKKGPMESKGKGSRGKRKGLWRAVEEKGKECRGEEERA